MFFCIVVTDLKTQKQLSLLGAHIRSTALGTLTPMRIELMI